MDKERNIIKDLIKKITKYGSKKIIEKAAIVAIIGAICLIAGSVLFKDTPVKNQESGKLENSENTEAVETMKQSEEETKSDVEKGLQSILSKIKGAGKVDVMVTFYSGNESILAIDEKTSDNATNEKDKEGGSRTITQSDRENKVIYEEAQGDKKPFIIKQILPKVKGVVIVADGAGDAEIKSSLAKATEALLDVAPHKIQVFQRDGN